MSSKALFVLYLTCISNKTLHLSFHLDHVGSDFVLRNFANCLKMHIYIYIYGSVT